MGTLTDITANANNTSLRNAKFMPNPLTHPGDENSGKAKSPHFMSPTVSSTMQASTGNPKVLKDTSSPTIAASNKKKGWMSSAAKRVGIHRGVHHSANKTSSTMIKAVAIPDKLANPLDSNVPASTSPTLSQDSKTHRSTKPLPSPPIAQITKNSPIGESRSLLDASEKPLRRSPPGRPQQEEDWPVLSPENVNTPKPAQSSQDTPPILGKTSEEKERYPTMTKPDFKTALKEFSSERVVRKPVSSIYTNSETDATTGEVAISTSTKDFQVIGSETPPTSAVAAPTSQGSRLLSSNDRILPRQTKTSELRARRSAGHISKDRFSTVSEGLGNSWQGAPRNFGLDRPQSPNVAFLSRNPLRESSRAPTHTSRVPTQFVGGNRRPVDNRYSSRGRDDFVKRQSFLGSQAPSRAAPAAPTSSRDSLLVAKTRIVPAPSAPQPTSIPLPHNVSMNVANTSANTSTGSKGCVCPGMKMDLRNEFKIYEDRSSAPNLMDAPGEHDTAPNHNPKSNANDQLWEPAITSPNVRPSSSMIQYAVNIKDQQATQFAEKDCEVDPYSPIPTIYDPSPGDASSHTPFIKEKMLYDHNGSVYDDNDKPSNGKTHVKHLSSKAPSFGPTLRISPSAERWVMGNDSKVHHGPNSYTSKRLNSGSSTFTNTVHDLVDSAVAGKRRGDRPASAQGLLHINSAGIASTRGYKEKRVKSAEMGYSLSTEHLRARIVRSQSQTANRISRFSNDMDPFLDSRSHSEGPQSNTSLSKAAGATGHKRQRDTIAEESSTNASMKNPSLEHLRLIIPNNSKNGPLPEVKHFQVAAALTEASEPANCATKLDERADVHRKTHKRTSSQGIGNSTPIQSSPFPPRTSSQATPPDFTIAKPTSFTLVSASTDAQHINAPTTAEEISFRPLNTRDSEITASKRASTLSQSSTTTKNALSSFRARVFHKRPVDKTPTPAATTSRKAHEKPTITTMGSYSALVAKPSAADQVLRSPSRLRLQAETPPLASPAPNPISTSTALVLSLCNRAQQDASSPHRSNILTLSTILAEAVNHAREAQRSMEQARLAAKESEGRWELCVESVKVIEGVVRGVEGINS